MNPLFIAAGAIALYLFSKKVQGSNCQNCGAQTPITTSANAQIQSSSGLDAAFSTEPWWSEGAAVAVGSATGGLSIVGGSQGAASAAAAAAGSGTASSGTSSTSTSTSTSTVDTSSPTINYSCFSPGTRIKLSDGAFTSIESFIRGRWAKRLQNLAGSFDFELIEHDYSGQVIVIADCQYVTPDHPMTRNGSVRADRYYPADKFERIDYVGKVYDISVKTENEDAKHFILESGDVAHNKPISQVPI